MALIKRMFGDHCAVTELIFSGLLIVLAASCDSSNPKGTSGGSQEPFVADKSEYAFLRQDEALVGGQSSASRAVYIDGSGRVQDSREINDGLTQLNESQVDPTTVFSALRKAAPGLAKVITPRDSGGSGTDSYPPYVYFYGNLSGFGVYYWAGEKASLPAALRDALAPLDTLSGTAVPSPASVYLRATVLDAATLQEFGQAGTVISATTNDIDANSLLRQCLQTPYRLIAADNVSNPFAPFRGSFKPAGDALELIHKGTGYQIRSLSGPATSRPSVAGT